MTCGVTEVYEDDQRKIRKGKVQGRHAILTIRRILPEKSGPHGAVLCRRCTTSSQEMATMAAELIAPDARDRRGWLWLAILVAVWSLESLVVQQYTSVPNDTCSPLVILVKYAARRMVLNVLASLFLVCLLNRLWLYFVFGLGLILSNVLIVCADYFDAPLSWFMVRHQWQEGLAVADHGVTLIQWPVFLLLLAALAVKVALRERLHRHLGAGLGVQRVGWIAAASFLALAIGLAGVYKPITRIKFGGPEYVYGYTIAWVAEGVFFDDQALLQLAIDAAQQRSDRLSPLETPLDLGDRVAIVQVESLDWDAIDAQVGGQWVMPFLHDLKTRSLFYAVQPVHETGTSDADFTLLTGRMPNGKVAPFKIEDYAYQNTLPQLARQRGFSCIAIHGNAGGFFYRRPAYEKMGFSQICFAEELRTLGCKTSHGGVNDDEVFRLSAEWLNQACRPTVHFIITLTSHGPFDRVPAERIELFPHPSCRADAYLNSMRYVDRVLADYLEALPEGTVLVAYGDHDSKVQGYRQAHPTSGERVPCLIHCKGRNLADGQRTRGLPWTQSGELHMLDFATFVHKSLKQHQDTSGLARLNNATPDLDSRERSLRK
jgi:hypothetical protein